MATWPGYNYLGPGNDLSDHAPIVNSTDFIAYIHDLEYALAEKPEDIRAADREAISSFLTDFKSTRRVADLVGILGLGIKYGIESVFKVQYPRNIGGSDRNVNVMGRDIPCWNDYLEQQKLNHFESEWNRLKHQYPRINDYKLSSEGKELRKHYDRNGHYWTQLRQRYEQTYGISLSGGGGGANKRNRVGDEQEEISPNKLIRCDDDLPDNPEVSRNVNYKPVDNSRAGDFSDDYLVDEVPDMAQERNNGQEPMDVAESGTSRGPNTGLRDGASGSGGSSSSGSASTSIQGNLTYIHPSQPSKWVNLDFSKTRILYSYGYAVKECNKVTYDAISTPLALIPVDFLPFYLSHAEWDSLPAGSKVLQVNCTVTPLGTRTAFDVGTTVSGSATSEYVPIGLVAHGANIQFYGSNKKYESQSADPMSPGSVKNISADEMAKNYYTHVISNAMCVPMPINEYWVHEWNKSKSPDPKQYPQYQVHNRGVARADEVVTQFLINQFIGKPIANYSYTPKEATIRKNKEHFIPYNKRNNCVETCMRRPRSLVLKYFEDGKGSPSIGRIGFTGENKFSSISNRIDNTYERRIENYGTFNLISGTPNSTAQPQLHVGLVATPQLNPATSNVTYLNSACYWKVECSIKIAFNIRSAFSLRQPVSWPREVDFYSIHASKYTDGTCYFGLADIEDHEVEQLPPKQTTTNKKQKKHQPQTKKQIQVVDAAAAAAAAAAVADSEDDDDAEDEDDDDLLLQTYEYLNLS